VNIVCLLVSELDVRMLESIMMSHQ